MSARKIDAQVVANILAQRFDSARGHFSCGCSKNMQGRWWLCPYHDGYQDGLDDARRLLGQQQP